MLIGSGMDVGSGWVDFAKYAWMISICDNGLVRPSSFNYSQPEVTIGQVALEQPYNSIGTIAWV